MGHRLVLDLRHLTHGYRTGQVDLFLHAVPDHHHVVEHLRILLQHHCQARPVADGHRLGIVSDKRDVEMRAGRHAEYEFTFRIGHHTVCRAVDQNVRTHDRITGLRLDTTRQLVFGLRTPRFGLVQHDVAAFDLRLNSLVGQHAVQEFHDVLLAGIDRNAFPQVDFTLAIPERVAALRLDRFDYLAHSGVLQGQRNQGILRVKDLRRDREPTQRQQSAQSAQRPPPEKAPKGPPAGRICTHKV